MRPRLKPRPAGPSAWRIALYYLGRLLQISGLLITLVAATQYFGTRHMTAMLNMMLVGVLFFIPGWLLARKDPTQR
jgi:hypothetical protein